MFSALSRAALKAKESSMGRPRRLEITAVMGKFLMK